jgi:uncharacterized protein
MSEHPMDNIAVRGLRFDFDEVNTDDFVWSQSCPEFSIFINALGIHVPYFEKFLVQTMRTYRDDLDDAELLEDIKRIIGQESHHAFNFKQWNQAMRGRYPKVAALEQESLRYFEELLESKDKQSCVGFTAGYETFTFLGGMIILGRYEELMGRANPTLRALWVWHQVEEVEHGAVAFDFYKAFFPEREGYRRLKVAHAFMHISWQTLKAYAHMLRVEGYYKSLRRTLRGWRFFFSFAFDLARSALPVFARNYHPRMHPICNDSQSEIAVAWRAYIETGGDPIKLHQNNIEQMLGSA